MKPILFMIVMAPCLASLALGALAAISWDLHDAKTAASTMTGYGQDIDGASQTFAREMTGSLMLAASG